jgi:NADH:ubiquinone oxidoreductase subunit E
MTNQAVDESDRGRLPDDNDILALIDELNVTDESNLIAVLQCVQARFGYLPRPALEEISLRACIPLSRIYGVVTFYAQFYTEPRGLHTIRCCRGTACHVRGGKSVIHSVRNALGIDDGQTTDDMMFTFETVACLGACALAPVMVVDNTYYGKATPRRVQEIIGRIAEEGRP